ncbi:hypothetical protein [Teichococcus oryzae]|uniref:Acetyl-CoA carboxylase biotin carboxyl carrier protein subunit n=1 Tax=Teichococcus oryzae TaxID=1608942 RepID=A0A5B2TEP2_9PROT|nr:hypothetical protein [Pseudoroseomonas oryzae]KAA2212976.1 hypothetical protein F0Q34_12705 [Pseudoroseomonas oryzae]
MTDPQSLAEIARHMAARGIEVLEVRSGDRHYRLVAEAEAAPVAAAPPSPPPAGHFTKAAGIGRLRFHHPQRGRPETGNGAVRKGQVLAYLQAGLLLQPVLAPCDGTIGPALAEEGALLGHGDKVFAIRPG